MKGRAREAVSPLDLSVAAVRRFYQSDVVIETFNAGFEGRWHTRVHPDVPGIEDSDHFVCHLLGIENKHRVLDFGSGSGVTSCGIATRTGCRVRGLNVSEKQVELAEQFAAFTGHGRRVSFDVYPGRIFPYRDDTFDRATFFESPCHVPHKPLLFREIFRVLKPGGGCAGQDWMLAHDDIGGADYERYIRPIEESCEVRLISLAKYERLMKRAGFVDVRTFDGRDLDPVIERGFSPPSKERIRVGEDDDLATRLKKGAQALSNAFHAGLFTIGFVHGKKPGERRSKPIARPRTTSIVPTNELVPADFAIEKNLACIDLHRRTFGIESSAPLSAFERLVAGTQSGTVETSCKIERGTTRATRFNLFYHGRHQEHFLGRALSFFEEVERKSRLRLDRTKLRAFLGKGIDFASVSKVVTGIDLHPERARSRLKLWFMLKGPSELAERAMALDDVPAARMLHFHDEFLAGFDLRFDGTCGVKLYPDVRPDELRDPKVKKRLSRVLSPKSLEAMEECSWTHVYLAKHNEDTVLQFHPRDPDAFVAKHLPKTARAVHDAYRGLRMLDMVASMQDGALQRGNVDSFALYYMPADPPR